MYKFVAVGLALAITALSFCARDTSVDRALDQKVSVHFREINVAGAMDFLAMHGINVAARTTDINLREHLALNVSNSNMRNVMQAIAGALGAKWTRVGTIFVLTRTAPVPSMRQLHGSFKSLASLPTREPDETESVFAPEEEEPSAIVTDGEERHVTSKSMRTMTHSYLVKLNESGEWAIAEQWTNITQSVALRLKPKLSIGQRKLLSSQGSLSINDLTRTQIASLGQKWPDGNYHAISGGVTVVIRP